MGASLDGDLPNTSATALCNGIARLVELSVVNYAIGVLITRGRTPEEAQAELRRRAAVELTSVTEVARQVLASIPVRPLAGDASPGLRYQ